MALAVLVVGTLLALWVRSRLSVERPGASQQIAEMLLNNPMGFGLRDVLSENAGHHWERYIPMVGSIALFVLLGNLVRRLSVSYRAHRRVYRAAGLRDHHVFVFQLAGHSSSWPGRLHETFHRPGGRGLSPLMFPVEILSTYRAAAVVVRPSWANIFASDIIYGLFLGPFRRRVYLRLDEISDSWRTRRRASRAGSHSFYASARFRFRRAGLRFHHSARRIHRHGHGGRALNRIC